MRFTKNDTHVLENLHVCYVWEHVSVETCSYYTHVCNTVVHSLLLAKYPTLNSFVAVHVAYVNVYVQLYRCENYVLAVKY